MRISFLLAIIVLFFAAGPASAQLTQDDLLSHNPTDCGSKVSAQSLIDGSELAFTGKVIKVKSPYIWFRVYVVHSGKVKHHIVKAAGFREDKGFVAGMGQSYEQGSIYTVVMRSPESFHEKNLKVDYINALDSCGESVVSKVHDRYGKYRVTKDQLKPGEHEELEDNLYFYGMYYLAFLGFVIVAGGAIGYAIYRRREGEEE